MNLLIDKFLGVSFCLVGGLLPAMTPKRVDLTGKTAIVTGGNSGVGYGLALQLAEMGATVYLACRNETRATQAQADMLKVCPDAKIETISLDTASFDSVRTFAKEWKGGQIDILAHNAGVSNAPKGKAFTGDGFEFLYQLLAQDARVIFTSSVGSYAGSLSNNFGVGKVQFKVEANFHGAGGMASYAQTKLMQVACAKALQAQFDAQVDNKRLMYSWEPGLVQSNLLRDVSAGPQDPAVWVLGKFQPIVGLDVRQGSATGVHLATSDSSEVLQGRGRYFDRMRARAHTADGYSKEMLDRLVG